MRYINNLEETETYRNWPHLSCPDSHYLHHICMQDWCRCLYHTGTAQVCT